MLPAFSEANINAYLVSINSSVIGITTFYNDLNTNWLGAFQSRFTLTPANTTLLNNFDPAGKAAIIEAMFNCSRWANFPNILFPIEMEIIGFASPVPPQAMGLEDWKIKAEGCTYYDPNGVMRFTVKKVTVEAPVPQC